MQVVGPKSIFFGNGPNFCYHYDWTPSRQYLCVDPVASGFNRYSMKMQNLGEKISGQMGHARGVGYVLKSRYLEKQYIVTHICNTCAGLYLGNQSTWNPGSMPKSIFRPSYFLFFITTKKRWRVNGPRGRGGGQKSWSHFYKIKWA